MARLDTGGVNGAAAAIPHSHDIRDYGAVGDGKANDAAAIQKAIDACTAAGGGSVYCPPGTYRIGTVCLKDNVELYLEAGCTLLASLDKSDYEPNFLIYARGASHIAICGRGTIDGNGRGFFSPPKGDISRMTPRDWWPRCPIPAWRPRAMLHLLECRHVWIRDIQLLDSMFYTVWPVGCEHVRIQGISIRNNRLGPNTDGVNPDCCRDVHISDCYIEAGDDAIAVKSDVYTLGKPGACEQITVTNCTLISPMCGIRIGYEGDGPIRDCTFDNLVIVNTRRGICVQVAVHDGDGTLIRHGPSIENIAFSNIVMDTMKAFFFWIDHGVSAPGYIRNVSISNVIGTTERSSYVCGTPAIPLEGLRFHNIQLTVSGETDSQYALTVPDPYGADGGRWGNWGTKGIPCALYFRNIVDLELHDIRIKWGRIAGPWMEAVRMENVARGDVTGLVARQAPGNLDAAVIRTVNVSDISLRGCRAEAGTGTFLRVEGGQSVGITAAGNDWQRAAKAVDMAPDVPPTALSVI